MHEPQSPTAAPPRIELLPLKPGLPAGQDSEVTVLAWISAASAPPPGVSGRP